MTEKLSPIICESVSVQYDLEEDRLILTLHTADASFLAHVTSRFARVFIQTLFKSDGLVTYCESTEWPDFVLESHSSPSAKSEEAKTLTSTATGQELKAELLTTFDITFHAEATVLEMRISGVALTLSLAQKDVHNLLLIVCRKIYEAEWNYHYWPAWLKMQVEQSTGSKIVH